MTEKVSERVPTLIACFSRLGWETSHLMSTNMPYTYDSNGNTLTKTNSTGTTSYTWDFENRLATATLPGHAAVTFKYDPFGRRIQKGTEIYLYDGANVIEDLTHPKDFKH